MEQNRTRHVLDSHGRSVTIRPAAPGDRGLLTELSNALSPRSVYLRFFSSSRSAAEQYLCALAEPSRGARATLLALQGADLVGVAAFEPIDAAQAELSVLVSDSHQHCGIGTLLIESLVDQARNRGLSRFVAEVLADNGPMMRVFRDLGLHFGSSIHWGVDTVTIDIEQIEEFTAARAERERASTAASLEPMLRPRSLVVIGAGRREGSVGHEVLRNILDSGYTGTVSVVNPHRDTVLGLPCLSSVVALAKPADLAIIALPAEKVVAAVTECGIAGVRAILVLTSGFSETGSAGRALQQQIVELARHYGLRLLGPNCLGVLNTDPTVRLNATFATLPMTDGGVCLVSQSGALGIAIAQAAHRLGLGLAQFISCGNKADVTGTDLLLAYERDPRARVMALYSESLGDPRRLARVARRISCTKPVVTLKSGRSEAGRRAGMSHTAAAATDDVLADALYDYAGILRVDTVEQLLQVCRFLQGQRLPAGPRVAVVGNSGGPEILTADAADRAGLIVPTLSPQLRQSLARLAPGLPSSDNPVDLGAGVQPLTVRQVVSELLASDDVDAVIAVFVRTLVADEGDILAAISGASRESDKPVLIARLGGSDATMTSDEGHLTLPVFSFGETAASTLGAAWRYAHWRQLAQADSHAPSVEADRTAVATFIASQLATGAEWLDSAASAHLLRLFGIQSVGQKLVSEVEEAVKAAADLGYPVAVKPGAGLVHKTESGSVLLGLSDEAALRAGIERIRLAVGDLPLLVQRMAEPGIELILGGLRDPLFGPLVMVGAGGVFTELLADRRYAFAPLSPDRALGEISRLRNQRLLDGFRGQPGVSRPALARLLANLSTLMMTVAEVVEVDLNPVVCRDKELQIVDAKIRIRPSAEDCAP